MHWTGRTWVVAPVLVLALAGCGGSDGGAGGAGAVSGTGSAASAGQAHELHPDVVDATVSRAADGSFTVAATVSSPYDSPSRYADAIRVRTTDGQVLGTRELLHDHASEQPFTRDVTGVVVPDGVTEVVVEGHDMVSGWGGATTTVPVPTG